MSTGEKKRIGVYLLTGYLGAGKTTTLNNLLKLPEIASAKPALIINEFGKMGVDGKLVEPGDYDKYEINKGSVFCICTKTDFIKALGEIIEKDIDLVIIEATGIAETRDFEAFVTEPHVAEYFEILANLCLVDASTFTKLAPYLKAVTSQVQWADGIIINKTDMATAKEVDRLRAVLTGINPAAKICDAQFGKIEPEFLSSLTHTERTGDVIDQPPADIKAVSLKTDKPVSRDAFLAVVESLGDKLLRLKGNIAFDTGPRFVELASAKLREKQPNAQLGAENETSFTAIAWKMTPEQITEAFEKTWAT